MRPIVVVVVVVLLHPRELGGIKLATTSLLMEPSSDGLLNVKQLQASRVGTELNGASLAESVAAG